MDSPRRPYAPPEITRIPLRPEEITTGNGCKLGEGGNKLSACDMNSGGCVNNAAGS